MMTKEFTFNSLIRVVAMNAMKCRWKFCSHHKNACRRFHQGNVISSRHVRVPRISSLLSCKVYLLSSETSKIWTHLRLQQQLLAHTTNGEVIKITPSRRNRENFKKFKKWWWIGEPRWSGRRGNKQHNGGSLCWCVVYEWAISTFMNRRQNLMQRNYRRQNGGRFYWYTAYEQAISTFANWGKNFTQRKSLS